MFNSKHNRKLTNLRMKYVDLCLKRKFQATVLRGYRKEVSRGYYTTVLLRAQERYGELNRLIRKTRREIRVLEEQVFVGSLLESIGLRADMTSEEVREHLNSL